MVSPRYCAGILGLGARHIREGFDVILPKGLRCCVAAAILALSGCVASTVLVKNNQVSADVSAKGFKSYTEVLFIPPKEDPRDVVPRAVSELQALGYKVTVVDPLKGLEISQGTGFLIGSDGYVLTCAHVLGDKKEATITLDGTRLHADVIGSDAKADLALLKLRDKLPESATVLTFRDRTHAYSMGEDVFTIGYPLSRLLGNSARMTKGLLSATTGLRDDPNLIQVSAEIQPGNSGGPLLDHDGHILGVVQQTMNPWRVAQATGGALPQNINFAIKNDPILDFLKLANPDMSAKLRFDQASSLEKAVHAVAKVQAGIVDDTNNGDKMVVRLFYAGRWDMWYRFTKFVVAAFDYDSGEPLFAAGQGHDNMISNEDVVIKDTFAEFRKAVAAK
jgi:serine protease Do